jgi:hypothetical protein
MRRISCAIYSPAQRHPTPPATGLRDDGGKTSRPAGLHGSVRLLPTASGTTNHRRIALLAAEVRPTVAWDGQGWRQSNARLGLTIALSVSRQYSIKLYASKAIATRIGGDSDIVGLVLPDRWGGGL